MLNVGRLEEILLACREKNPLFLVENEGYPLICSLLALAVAQVTFSELADPFICISPYPFLGLDFPLTLSYGLVKPGLDQPPPLLGDGDRDNDIFEYGVPGIGGNDEPPVGRPDAAPERSFDLCVCRFSGLGEGLRTDDVRRRRCVPVSRDVEDGEATMASG